MKTVLFHIRGVPVHLWAPKPQHGDYSTDVAFVCAKVFGGTPLEWAERLVRRMIGDSIIEGRDDAGTVI